ncbi:hypothetical protein ID866_966 [Astraeus odoratus]|nr:hypothetical protein ID866_966 [Astraeus odoratus]
MYRRDGRDADSSACPRQSAVERWLEKHRDDKVKKKGADQRR